jgi:putative transposase
MEYQRDEHRVHRILSHLVWTPKRRKAAWKNALAGDGRRLMEQPCAEQGWAIVELAFQPDHSQLFVRVWPSVAAADSLFRNYPPLGTLKGDSRGSAD